MTNPAYMGIGSLLREAAQGHDLIRFIKCPFIHGWALANAMVDAHTPSDAPVYTPDTTADQT